MLIRITNHCVMGCSHCMIEGSGPEGEHMSREVFEDALRLSVKLGSRILCISGGEPTEHPEFELYMGALRQLYHRFDYRFMIVVMTNGLFALDSERRAAFDRALVELPCHVQVTNDPRYYGRDLSLVAHLFERPGWSFTSKLPGGLMPCRRVREHQLDAEHGHEAKKYPACTNLACNVGRMGLRNAIQALEFQDRACCPSINVDGTVRLGETDTCLEIGTVTDEPDELEQRINKASCNRCKLWGNVPTEIAKLAPVGMRREMVERQ